MALQPGIILQTFFDGLLSFLSCKSLAQHTSQEFDKAVKLSAMRARASEMAFFQAKAGTQCVISAACPFNIGGSMQGAQHINAHPALCPGTCQENMLACRALFQVLCCQQVRCWLAPEIPWAFALHFSHSHPKLLGNLIFCKPSQFFWQRVVVPAFGRMKSFQQNCKVSS